MKIKELVSGMQANHENAWFIFDQQFRGYMDSVARSVSITIDTDEVYAKTVLRIMRHINIYEVRTEEPDASNQFRGWLRRYVRYSAMDMIRSDVTRQKHYARIRETSNEGYHQDVSEPLVANETHTTLSAALGQLKAADRQIIELRYFDSLTIDEIAKKLNCTTNNTSVRLCRAMKKAKTLLENSTNSMCQ